MIAPDYLIDTDWVIDALSGRQNTIARLEELGTNRCGISIITNAELYEGIYHSMNTNDAFERLGDFFSDGY
ncbi:MAG: type II toxin-antitoxin system VapC family toxin, partial [Candidatus Poribacteria bacterium]|nr:type II toxin-antitoxin system VapC family toxin [Candidatus Poribacteria bacterium]